MKKYIDTIKAKEGYNIRTFTHKITGVKTYVLCDGDNIIDDTIKMITLHEHYDNVRNNECYKLLEVFTTRKGNQCLYCIDTETNETFVAKV